MKEIWKQINGYEHYEVSNLGNVRSKHRLGTKGGVLAKASINGYLKVKLFSNGKQKTMSIHRLVAVAFIPNTNNLPQINHKDGNKHNNCVDNLEWCSCKDNIAHSYENGLRKTRKVQQLKNGVVIATYLNMHQASVETGIDYGNIYRCCCGIFKQTCGFEWRIV